MPAADGLSRTPISRFCDGTSKVLDGLAVFRTPHTVGLGAGQAQLHMQGENQKIAGRHGGHEVRLGIYPTPLPAKKLNDPSTPFFLPPFSAAIFLPGCRLWCLDDRLGRRLGECYIWEANTSLIYEKVPFFAPSLLGERATLMRIRWKFFLKRSLLSRDPLEACATYGLEFDFLSDLRVDFSLITRALRASTPPTL